MPVGLIYTTKERIEDNFGYFDSDEAYEVLREEAKDYSRYIQGDCYHVIRIYWASPKKLLTLLG